jgi:hypothetical protein
MMLNRPVAFLLAGTTVVCSAFLGLAACSSDDTGTGELPAIPVAPTADGGKAQGPAANPSPTGADASAGNTGKPSASEPADAGTDCGDPKKYPKLRPSADAGVYCPFQARTAADASAPPCDIGAHCCIYPQNANKASTCNPEGTACEALPGTADFACSESSDCPTGNVCCFGGEPKVDPVCPGKNFAKGVKGSACRATCGAGEYVVCTKDSDCETGKTCTPFSAKSIDFGACL